jgi:hypothetical protein
MDSLNISNVKVLPEVAFVRGGMTNIAVNESTNMSIFFTSNCNGILIHREFVPNARIGETNFVNLLVTFILPIRLADGLVEIGQTACSTGVAQYTVLPQRKVFSLDYPAGYTLAALERLVVPAGPFEVLRFVGTFGVSGNSESETSYPVRNTGTVKHEIKSNDHTKIMALSLDDRGL